jgi:glycosyltransferase involved in cell wall biosynthesis
LSSSTKEASVIIPALNEEKGIRRTLDEIKRLSAIREIIVVDGGSVDGTAEIAEKTGARVVIQRNVGYGNALYQGIKCLDSNVKYVVFTDADFTYPAEHVPKMVDILEREPRVGMVIGNRLSDKANLRNPPTRSFYIGNRLIAITAGLLGVKLRDPLSGFRVVRTDILREWKPKSQGFEVEVELNSLVEREGFQIAEIPINYRARLGTKKLNLKHGFQILRRIINSGLER